MKKFISFVMAGAMVASLVPATAFASSGDVTATAKIVGSWEKTADFETVTDLGDDDLLGGEDGDADEYTEGVISNISDTNGDATGDDVPELQLKVTNVDYLTTATAADTTLEITVSLDNADFLDVDADNFDELVSVIDDDGNNLTEGENGDRDTITVDDVDYDDDEVTFTLTGRLDDDDVIIIQLQSTMDKTSKGKKATVSVDSDAVTADDLVYCTVLDTGISASVKDTVDIAEDEVTTLDSHGIKIESSVDDFVDGQPFELKLSSGFEFSSGTEEVVGDDYKITEVDDKVIYVEVDGDGIDEFTIDGDDIEIEATTAKSGAVATLTVKAVTDDHNGDDVDDAFSDSTTVEVAKVVDYSVNLTVDEDEDVPVIYSGVNVDNTGITDDSDHMSLEVTAEETFPGAWSMRKGFNFNLPDGVYVTDIEIENAENFEQGGTDAIDNEAEWEEAFYNAYQDGDHKNFEFEKRVFDDVDTDTTDGDAQTLTFQLELVADPDFEGDVVLTMEGDLLDTQEVTIAKFVKPYTVKAEQNDVIIDYRNTAIDTPIVITEAEGGLFAEDSEFVLNIEDNLIEFDGDPEVTADDDSDMTIKDDDTDDGTFVFAIDDESDSAATITISDMELYMNRSIPAGGYDLEISTTMNDAYDRQVLYAADDDDVLVIDVNKDNDNGDDADYGWAMKEDRDDIDTDEDSYIDDVTDYSTVVKEAFINVVTSGRDQDNLFTTKVVVPVGEAYLIAGETQITLDAPAYISAAGYTMLPVRAVSKALGVDTNNVLWNAETRTVTIMYAQRIISMTVGQKTVYVNGSAIPTSAAPEIKDGRTFLPLRDLGTALGVTDVSWDSATKTATLNGAE